MDHPAHDEPAGGAGGPRRFAGTAELRNALRAALLQAAGAGETCITLVDADFNAWPLDDSDLLSALTTWARGPQRQLKMLAKHFDDVPRRHPRFTVFRRVFAHVVECRAAPALDASELPLLLLAGRRGLYAVAGPRFAGTWLGEAGDLRTWRGVAEAITQRSEAAFPAHPLGL